MSRLTTKQEIAEYISDRALRSLDRRRHYLLGPVERAIDWPLGLVPFPVRKFSVFLLEMDRQVGWFSPIHLMTVIMAASAALIGVMLLYVAASGIWGRDALPHFGLVGLCSIPPVAATLLAWSTNSRLARSDEVDELQQIVADNPAWAEPAARMIAARGTLRASDALFFRRLNDPKRNMLVELTEALQQDGFVNPDDQRPPRFGHLRRATRWLRELYTQGNTNRAAVMRQLEGGVLGSHLQQQALEGRTPPSKEGGAVKARL